MGPEFAAIGDLKICIDWTNSARIMLDGDIPAVR
jgi:hypothetical protein